MEPCKSEFVNVNGIRMHYITAGKGPLLILLHGFPQSSYAWRHQLPALTHHFQVVAPDLRGYGQTEKPRNVSDYRTSQLTADIVGLIHALGHESAHIVGHDWGGVVAWKLALEYPEVINRLVVLNAPHPHIFSRVLRSSRKQIMRSWYIFFFQIPYVPELVFKLFSKKLLNSLFRGSSIRKDTFSDVDIEKYHQALTEPGAITAALNYYRAAFHKVPTEEKSEKKNKKIAAPTLLIWGEADTALGKELTYGMEQQFEGPFHIQYIPNCSHWVNEEQPELVNRALIDFLK